MKTCGECGHWQKPPPGDVKGSCCADVPVWAMRAIDGPAWFCFSTDEQAEDCDKFHDRKSE